MSTINPLLTLQTAPNANGLKSIDAASVSNGLLSGNSEASTSPDGFLNAILAQIDSGKITPPQGVTINDLKAEIQALLQGNTTSTQLPNTPNNTVPVRKTNGIQLAQNEQAISSSSKIPSSIIKNIQEIFAQLSLTSDSTAPDALGGITEDLNLALSNTGTQTEETDDINLGNIILPSPVIPNTNNTPIPFAVGLTQNHAQGISQVNSAPNTHPNELPINAVPTAEGISNPVASPMANPVANVASNNAGLEQRQNIGQNPNQQQGQNNHGQIVSAQAQLNKTAPSSFNPVTADAPAEQGTENAPTLGQSTTAKEKVSSALNALQNASQNPQQSQQAQQALQSNISKLNNNVDKASGQSSGLGNILGTTLGAQPLAGSAGFDMSGGGQGQNGAFFSDGDGFSDLSLLSADGLKNANQANRGAFTSYLQTARGNMSQTTQNLSIHMQKGIANKADTMNIQLTPENLGRVDVKLQFGDDGIVKAHLVIDRPETLALLQRDAQNLEQALKDAGIDVDSNSLSFDLKQNQDNDGNKTADDHKNNIYSAHNDTVNDNSLNADIAIQTNQYVSKTGVNILI